MNQDNDRIRRELGLDLVKAARDAGIAASGKKPGTKPAKLELQPKKGGNDGKRS